jgi:hypothetical protein
MANYNKIGNVRIKQFWRDRSLSFSYLEQRKSAALTVYSSCLKHFNLRLTLEMRARVRLHVQCPFLFLSDFNQNWNVSTNFSKTTQE